MLPIIFTSSQSVKLIPKSHFQTAAKFTARSLLPAVALGIAGRQAIRNPERLKDIFTGLNNMNYSNLKGRFTKLYSALPATSHVLKKIPALSTKAMEVATPYAETAKNTAKSTYNKLPETPSSVKKFAGQVIEIAKPYIAVVMGTGKKGMNMALGKAGSYTAKIPQGFDTQQVARTAWSNVKSYARNTVNFGINWVYKPLMRVSDAITPSEKPPLLEAIKRWGSNFYQKLGFS